MHIQYSLLIFFLLFLLVGCNNKNSEIPVPSYLEIQNFTLQNENAIGITDVWVKVNGNNIGVFEIPANFPVIAEGLSTVSISAGIKVNGISSTRTYYPFYEPFKKTVNFQPSEVIKIAPQTTYYTWANIKWEESFENGHKFEKNDKSDTVFVITDKEQFKGLYSGAIYLDTSNIFFESYTPELIRPDFSGSPGMYIELNYKCDNPFDIGVYISYQQQVIEKNILTINTTSEWKKIYIDLHNPLLKYPEGTVYKIYIGAYHYISKSNSSIFIDNFKVVQSSDK